MKINILDSLFESRKYDFYELCYKNNTGEDALELIDNIRLMIRHNVKDKILQKELLEKLNRYDELLDEEINSRYLQFYKLGFKDAIKIMKEIK